MFQLPMKPKTLNRLLGGLLLCFYATAAQAGGTHTVLVFAERFERDLTGRWEQLKFGRPTEYCIVDEGASPCLKAVANRTCSALLTKVAIKPATRLIARWQWKINHIPTNSTDRIAGSFDHTARIIIAFDTFLGPPRTLNYIWANQEKIGATLPHPLSGRAQMIALESGNQNAGRWLAEERDVTADWHQLFGDKPMPEIVAVGVITDSENTGTQVTGYYRGIELLAE